MSNSMVHDREKIVAALTQIAGEYRTSPQVRTMLVIVFGMLVPLAALILVRLLGWFLPPAASLSVAGALVLLSLCFLLDLMLGVLRLDPAGIERHSPWFWWSWRAAVGEIAAIGTQLIGKGRHLVVLQANGKKHCLPFRPGFEKVLTIVG